MVPAAATESKSLYSAPDGAVEETVRSEHNNISVLPVVPVTAMAELNAAP